MSTDRNNMQIGNTSYTLVLQRERFETMKAFGWQAGFFPSGVNEGSRHKV